jgi:glutamyl/glutaminyl-tRNA synthetase
MTKIGAKKETGYRGRIAPTPTGFMHLGHAKTFLKAQERAREAEGTLLLRVEDLDRERCKEEFTGALIEDLRWAGLDWEEGPDVGGACGPYTQSDRGEVFRKVWKSLRASGSIFPCRCSRKDVQVAVTAPHESGGELIYPGICRDWSPDFDSEESAEAVNWRFRVPDGETIEFVDENLGIQRFGAGRDFGDFLVWRKDGIPSYELAVVADDIAMGITEVVRGEDLLLSTARQILLYRSLGCEAPSYYHCPLVLDESGRRLAKRHQSLGLREIRRRGFDLAALLGDGS